MGDIISDLYKVNLTANKYKVNIPSSGREDNCVVEIVLEDYNKNVVKNKSIVVECKLGVFTAYNNGSTGTISNLKSTTQSTGSVGKLSLTYKPTNVATHGYDTISVIINGKVQKILVLELYEDTGWLPITYLNSNYTDYSDSNKVKYRCYNGTVEIDGIFKATTTLTSSYSEVQFGSIPSQYAPPVTVHRLEQGSGGRKFLISVNPEGKLYWSKNAGTEYVNLTESASWMQMDIVYSKGG